jgi:glucokinase
MECIAGVDIGGTKVAIGVGNEMGQILSRSRRSTAECGDGDALLLAVCGMVDDLLEESGSAAPLTRIGLALPGPVDVGQGCLIGALTLPKLNFRDLRAFFEDRYQVPVTVDNDANAAALGEAYFGAGTGAQLMVYFTVSTGVGGGIVHEGRLFRGMSGVAGEFGHQTVLPGGPLCNCGKNGCLEALVSGPAIARRAKTWVARHPGMASAALLGEPSAETVARAAVDGDWVAHAVWKETGYYLGIGIAHAIAAFGPDLVVVGGGVSQAGELLLDPARRAARRHTPAYAFGSVRIESASLGDNVGILGAIAIALEAAGIAPGDAQLVRGG